MRGIKKETNYFRLYYEARDLRPRTDLSHFLVKLDLAFNNVKPKDRYFVLD